MNLGCRTERNCGVLSLPRFGPVPMLGRGNYVENQSGVQSRGAIGIALSEIAELSFQRPVVTCVDDAFRCQPPLMIAALCLRKCSIAGMRACGKNGFKMAREIPC